MQRIRKISSSPSYFALVYFLCAVLWILGSDWLVSFLFYQSPNLLITAQQYKGLLFVLLTTVLIYVLLRSWKNKLHSYVNASPAVLYVLKQTDKGLVTEFVSENLERLLGYSVKDCMRDGWWFDNLYPADRSKAVKMLESAKKHSCFTHEYRFYDAQGQIREIRDEMTLTFDQKGHLDEIIGVWNDITTEKQQSKALHQAKVVFDNTQEGIMITDHECRILNVNKAFTEITGYQLSEVEGRDPSFLKSNRQSREYYQQMWESIHRNAYWQGEIYNRRKNGEIYPEILTINEVVDIDKNTINYVAIFSDISLIKASQKKLDFLSDYDVLTRLPNRFSMMKKLQQQIQLSQKKDQSFALFMLDLDFFKNINDSYGHSIGDELLKELSQRLTEFLYKNDSFSRLGGDEFAFWLSPLNKVTEAEKLAIDVLKEINRQWSVNQTHLELSASIGICIYPEDGNTSEGLLQNADAALYHAKSQGRNNFAFYRQELTELSRQRLELEAELKQALKNNEFQLYYQPQFSVEDDQFVGAEALIRWNSPTRGLVSPAVFIPLAEETGLIREIGKWVLSEACQQGRIWLDQGFDIQRLAVNVAAQQLLLDDLQAQIQAVLKQTGFPANLLELELTEGTLIDRNDIIQSLFKAIQGQGISIAVDDFGTGYSSLSYLKRFPVDILKIDKSFVDDIETDKDDRAIIRAIISMANSLELKVLAEGVETQAQKSFLCQQGCNFYQGYLKSPPVPADEFLNCAKIQVSESP
ncbi:EAL domain-containing protein [Thiomicrorhabdus indica]|uniref:bifunctional diguanylate cyclase/phosphodiesterase n=1 Tax=Thiomicrorhabdus indica TaxID=2267253 RepID=UPI002AA6BE65|nr:EAL domain-containing protein [Thiomicrorhabdus indica]